MKNEDHIGESCPVSAAPRPVISVVFVMPATFILYSTVVYPITNYIVSPARGYSKWKGICYAVLFLGAVAFIQLVIQVLPVPRYSSLCLIILCVHCYQSYDISEKESNFYSMLNVWRDCSVAELRRGYKRLSLELHPDKNRSAEAAALYQQVKAAYEVSIYESVLLYAIWLVNNVFIMISGAE